MIGYIPDLVQQHHGGGIGVFGDIAGFLALSLFAGVIVAALLLGKTAASVVKARSTIELLKSKKTVEQLKHELTIDTHQHKLQQLALTAGPSEPQDKASVRARVDGKPPLAEEVDPRDVEVVQHGRPWQDDGFSDRDAWLSHLRAKGASIPAEFRNLA